MTWTVIGISVIAYIIVGVAIVVMCILDLGEPKPGDKMLIVAMVLTWPIGLLITLPAVAAARCIKEWRAERREKPHVSSEYES